MTLQGKDDAVRINAGLVTGNFFEVMGLSPVLGRLTGPGDDGPGVPPVMVLTHEFWMKRFGGDPGIVGKQVRLDGNSVTVIGVLQPAPYFPDRVDALLNMVISPHHLSAMMVQGRTHRMTEMIARLAPGATVRAGHGPRSRRSTPACRAITRTRTIPGRTIASRSSPSRKCSASGPG